MTDHNQDQTQYSQFPQRPVQTLARAYAEIVAQREQVSPWVALNEFFHEWWDYSRTEHAQLIAEEVLPGGPSVLLDASSCDLSRDLSLPERDRRWRWAVFCAAVADYLSAREGMEPPAWVTDPRYTLTKPWYVVGTVDAVGNGDATDAQATSEALLPGMLLHLERTTPPQMRRRNIFCSERLFANYMEKLQVAGVVVAEPGE